MKLSIQKQPLAEAVIQVSTAVSPQTTIPILSGIKLTVENERCVFTASNSDISIQVELPNKEGEKTLFTTREPGSVVLPARFFVDIVRKLPEETVNIEADAQFATTIRTKYGEFQINGMDPDEFPRLPLLLENNGLSLSNRLVKDMIRQTAFAVSTTETRPILTGVLWQLEDNTLRFTATDSHRLAIRETVVETKSEQLFDQIVVPGKNLSSLSKLLKDDDTLADIVVMENQLLVKTENILFFTRLLEGRYPDISRIIPQESKTELIVSTKQLLHSIDRASLLSRELKNNVVKLVADDETVEISADSPQVGKVSETVQVEEITGGPLKISFNARFVLDALRVLDSERIRLSFTGPMTPFVLKPTDHERNLYLILPVRTY